jgi:AcrR family transcriptional regulator
VSEADRPDAGGEGLPRLPPGRHGLPREFVTENQRQRLAGGAIQTVAEVGYHAATVSQISAAAGVSRRTLYGYFPSKAECVFDTYELVTEFLLERMTEAASSDAEWPARVAARLSSLVSAYAANPDLARFTLIAPPAAGGELAARYRAFLERLLAALTADRPAGGRSTMPAAEQALIGGIAALIAERVAAGKGEQLPEMVPDLIQVVLAPYLGFEQAVAESKKR